MHCLLILIAVKAILTISSAQDNINIVEAVSGRSIELPCNVTADNEGDKLNILAWYKNGSSTAFYSSRDLREGAYDNSISSAGRYRLITTDFEDKLQIISVQPSDAGDYHCLADFESSPAHKTYVQLIVIEPPRHLWVVHDNGTQVAKASAGVNVSQNVGPYFVGDTVHLFCVAFGGNPQATLSWRTEQRLLKDSSTQLSKERVRSEIMFGPLRREDHGRILTCYAKNNDKTTPLSIDVAINMFLPPELVSLRVNDADQTGTSEHASGKVTAGETLTLQCRVLGAYPDPPVIWKLGDSQLLNLEENVTSDPSQRLKVSEIELSVDRQHDQAHATCCAPAHSRPHEHEHEQYVCAQGIELFVHYKPVLEIMVEQELDNRTVTVTKGSSLALACSYDANPPVYELCWFHEDDISNNSVGVGHIKPLLDLKNVTEEDAGNYACAAANDQGNTTSIPVIIEVIYPAYCEDVDIIEYGLGDDESINITCSVRANPEPSSYRWVMVHGAADLATINLYPQTTFDTDEPTLLYARPSNASLSTVFCWGLNGVPAQNSSHTPCVFLMTDETIPRPPTECGATKMPSGDIVVNCQKGHSGGLPQHFKFSVREVDSEEIILSIVNKEPEFKILEPKQDNYKFVINAFNDRGESSFVQILKEDIVDDNIGSDAISAVTDITTLSLALCGGVALVALAACGLVLCARDAPRPHAQPPLCAYNTDESNCETYHDSDDSECNVRRTDSFRRAVSKYPSKNFDVRRTSSFHSARYMNEVDQDPASKCNDVVRHNTNCRVHSLQNISRKREMDALCDHLVLHLPPETNYNVPRPMNTFYTMPRKMRHKLAKELSDEASEITQSDGFSLPPPPDEFGTYRAATRIKDIPKATPTYTTIARKNSGKSKTNHQQYTSPINSVGLPTISGAQPSVYSYPDEHGHQDDEWPSTTAGDIPPYQTYFTPRESGL